MNSILARKLNVTFKRTLIAAALASASLATAQAADASHSITGLVDTGINTISTASGLQDSSYHLLAASSDTIITNTLGYVTTDNAWPINPWIDNSTVSKWITPTASQAQSFDASTPGHYTYTLNFDLTGSKASTAAFLGRFAADNAVDISLNGHSIASGTGFTSWSAFGANSGFVSGVNALTFDVTNFAQNGGNPAGLRVEFLSSSVAAVPEPASYAMLLAGVGLIAFTARRKAIAKVAVKA